jgi:2-keto-4-pentenoate hydratase/2-oxohepta-3-ene-1,7-dioic acid hydratase in catechol pathway
MFSEPVDDVPFDKLSDDVTRRSEVVQERSAARQRHEFAGDRSPIARPHQILCIGLNYSDHAVETGAPVPDEPILFPKSPNSSARTTTSAFRVARPSWTGKSSWAL